jgi:Rho-binding antiterminator
MKPGMKRAYEPDRPYVPISCSVHDELLALATLRRECELTVEAGEGAAERVHGVIADVYSRGGAEYLELRDGRTFRLDRIVALDGRPVPPADWR